MNKKINETGLYASRAFVYLVYVTLCPFVFLRLRLVTAKFNNQSLFAVFYIATEFETW